MPRKGPAPKRPVVADPVYGAPIVSQLVNKILLDGKKGLAERIVDILALCGVCGTRVDILNDVIVGFSNPLHDIVKLAFYLEKTRPWQSIQLVRTPGFRRVGPAAT